MQINAKNTDTLKNFHHNFGLSIKFPALGVVNYNIIKEYNFNNSYYYSKENSTFRNGKSYGVFITYSLNDIYMIRSGIERIYSSGGTIERITPDTGNIGIYIDEGLRRKLSIPLMAGYRYLNRKFYASAYLGLNYSRVENSEISIRKNNYAFLPDTFISEKYYYMDYPTRRPYNIASLVDIEAGIKIRSYEIFFSLRFEYELLTANDKKKRYDNGGIAEKFGYIDNDYKFNYKIIGLGITRKFK